MRRPGAGSSKYQIITRLAATLGASTATFAPASAQQAVTLPTIEVVGTAPLSGSEIERDKVPANVQTLGPADFDHVKAPSLLDAINTGLPGVSLSDQTGNPFQLNLDYRGFTASPVIGTPQGLAVYQNGVRINEVFGDIVNWDFIPEMAVNRMTLVPNNPAFGLNALGGALSIDMKNGLTYQGQQAEVRGGSFGRRSIAGQAGGQSGDYFGYVTADAINDDGWRDQSSSQLRRMYADVGSKGDKGEFHLSFTGASNKFGATAAAPVELLNQRWSSIYTVPQTTRNDLAFLTANATLHPTDTLSLQGNIYYRGFWQRHVDGNVSDVEVCDDPTLLCLGDDTTPLLGSNGLQVPNILGGAVAGEIDRTRTAANSYGGSLQATSTARIFDHDNHLVIGASVDRGIVQFGADGELGTITPESFPFVNGLGVFISSPTGDVAPVSLRAQTTYTGIYATDTFDITSRLSLTAGGRFNVAQIKLEDQLGTALNGDNRYSRFNPVVGLTYKITPDVTAYAGYSEANRAPTPLELGCADPARPCLIDNFLVSDPPLKQVVAHTYEAGLRGNADLGQNGRLAWNVGVFHTRSQDDIINVPSLVTGHGFFQNAGDTLRRGIEAGASYKWERWTAYANYTFVDARFRTPLLLSSPNNPFADADGNIAVSPGDHIPGIPLYRFKAGFEYAVSDPWKVGVDLNVIGSQYLVGDESNLSPKVPAYWVVNLHTSYKVSSNVEVFGLVQNLFNQHYYVSGTFFEADQIPFLGLTDPRTFLPGAPLAAYAGLRATF
ncbi:MAG TPA: TonB-dependent receptor [Xanthobacteraceae bacterium]|nr:TonB-dependent receptor [Xanthobacteraceae bacterium]